MLIFEKTLSGHERVNFIDRNNRFVGFDMESQCCENYGWVISETESDTPWNLESIPNAAERVLTYVFNTDFGDKGIKDGDGYVVFQLISAREPNLYLYLFNDHNGYYSHGFEFGDIKITSTWGI